MPIDEKSRAVELYKRLQLNYSDLNTFMEPGYDGLVFHANSTIFYANDAISSLTEYSLEELIGLNAWLLFTSESIKTVSEKLAAKSEDPYQVTLKTKSGKIKKIELKGRNIDISGEPVRVMSVKVVP